LGIHLHGTGRVLYRLGDVLNSAEMDPDGWVFIAEGEKDATAWRRSASSRPSTPRAPASGQTSFPKRSAAGAWRSCRTTTAPAETMPAASHGHSQARPLTVRILELPDLPPKGDVSDWLDAGGTAEQLLRLVEQARPATPADTATDDEAEPPTLTLRQLVAKYPTLRRPVIHDLQREGETLNIIAPSKKGKSWLAGSLAISIAANRMWLDRFKVEQGNALIIDNELHAETLADRIPKIAKAMGVLFDECADRLEVRSLRGQLRDIFKMADFFGRLEPGRCRLIIVDALYRMLPDRPGTSENDNAMMASIFNQVDCYADGLKCGFALIHHSPKGNQSSKSVTDVGAGAGSQSRAADSHLVLRQHEEEEAFVVEAAVRSWPPLAPFGLRWEFPLWKPDPTLDVTRLRKDRPGSDRKAQDPRARGGLGRAEVRGPLPDQRGPSRSHDRHRRAPRRSGGRRDEAAAHRCPG
jgi:hypothetical protein